jgi:hypothetical protein
LVVQRQKKTENSIFFCRKQLDSNEYTDKKLHKESGHTGYKAILKPGKNGEAKCRQEQ